MAEVKNSGCYSSPCGSWVEVSTFHFETSDNLLIAPGMILLRLYPAQRQDVRTYLLFPFHELTILATGDRTQEIRMMRWLFVAHDLLKLAHLPLWILEFFALVYAWNMRTKRARGFVIACFAVLTIFFVQTQLGLVSRTGHADVTWRIFFDPAHAVFEAG